MRIHLVAMVALLTAAGLTGCDSARGVRNPSQENAWGCDQCHGYPPPPFFARSAGTALPAEFPHAGVTGPMCYVCHPRTVLSDGHTLVAGGEHRDGQIEAVYGGPTDPLPGNATCATCHDDPPDTGDHGYHVVTRGLACATCHAGYALASETAPTPTVDAATHMQGKPYIVVEGGIQITRQADETGKWPATECKACHAALHVGAPPTP